MLEKALFGHLLLTQHHPPYPTQGNILRCFTDATMILKFSNFSPIGTSLQFDHTQLANATHLSLPSCSNLGHRALKQRRRGPGDSNRPLRACLDAVRRARGSALMVGSAEAGLRVCYSPRQLERRSRKAPPLFSLNIRKTKEN